MVWLCPLSKYVDILASVNVTVFGNWVFTDVIKLRRVHPRLRWALIQ